MLWVDNNAKVTAVKTESVPRKGDTGLELW